MRACGSPTVSVTAQDDDRGSLRTSLTADTPHQSGELLRPWREVSGALADLGTLLPIMVALVALNGLDATSVLVSVGLAYLMVGVVYRTPVAIQPLKSMSAIAIASGLGAADLRTAGFVFGVLLLLSTLTPLPAYLGKRFPRPLLRGLQLGVGLLLMRSALRLAQAGPLLVEGTMTPHIERWAAVSAVLALISAGLLAWWWTRRCQSNAAVVVGIGVLGGVLFLGTGASLATFRIGLSLPDFGIPDFSLVGAVLGLLVIPQLPLTLGNAVSASNELLHRYHGERVGWVTPRTMLVTTGAMNVVAAFLGGIPMCHGSSGITAHHRFGARTGYSVAGLGVVLLALGLFSNGNAIPILLLIPTSVLAVMLAFVGLQHASLARDVRGSWEMASCLVTGLGGFVTGNLALGFGLGASVLLVSVLLRRSPAIVHRPALAFAGTGHRSGGEGHVMATNTVKTALTRREFMGWSTALLALSGFGGLLKALPLQLAEATTVKWIPTTCLGCNARCGLAVRVEGGVATKIEGLNGQSPGPDGVNPLPRDPYNNGKTCARGQAGIEQIYNPDRTKYPMKRVGPRGSGKWTRLTWIQAYNEVAPHLRATRGKWNATLGMYTSDGSADPAKITYPERIVLAWGRHQGDVDHYVTAMGQQRRYPHTSLCQAS